MSIRCSREVFDELVRQALQDIPAPLAQYLRDVTIDVEPMPGPGECKAAGVGDPRTLMGLYQGTPLPHRSVEQSGRLPDRITIYQHNIERCCRTRRDVIHQVRKTVLHEIGHHFGLDESDLADLGYQ